MGFSWSDAGDPGGGGWDIGGDGDGGDGPGGGGTRGSYDLGVGWATFTGDENKGTGVWTEGGKEGIKSTAQGPKGGYVTSGWQNSLEGAAAALADNMSVAKGYQSAQHEKDADEKYKESKLTKDFRTEEGKAIYDAMAKKTGNVPQSKDWGWVAGVMHANDPGKAAYYQAVGEFNELDEAGHDPEDIQAIILSMADDRLGPVSPTTGYQMGSLFNPGNTAENFVESYQTQLAMSELATQAEKFDIAKAEQYADRDDPFGYKDSSIVDFAPDTQEARDAAVAQAWADLSATLEATGGKSLTSYEDALSAVARGVPADEIFGLTGPLQSAVVGAIPYGVGTMSSIASLFGSLVGESVIGTFTKGGLGFNLHEDGTVTLSSPTEGTYEGEGWIRGNIPKTFTTTGQGEFDRESALESIIQTLVAGEGLDEFRPNFTGYDRDTALVAELLRQNELLGEDVSEFDFNQAFGSPDIGRELLLDVERMTQEDWRNRLGETFTGEAFAPFAPDIDDEIINSIVEGRSREPRELVSTQEARGSLNPFGGRTANIFLSEQIPKATERVGEVSGSLLGETQRDIDALRGTTLSGITDFRLGDPLFDFGPATTQRQDLITGRLGSLRGDIETALGSEPIFDVQGALSAGGRSQGVVSGGTTTNTLLDTLAQREMMGEGTERRGLGSRGTGAF